MSNNLKILSDLSKLKEKDSIYIALRKKEGRVYSDEIVKVLPDIEEKHPLSYEWKIRKASFEKLKEYLSNKNQSLEVLDLGCGNGWLGNALAQINDFKVTCVDINLAELEQGARVFGRNKNIKFIFGDIFETTFGLHFYDIIIIAAAVQYHPSVEKLISRLLRLLKPGGEIHIMDSPIYKMNTVAAAKKRSENYYKQLGFEEMKSNYYHHSWNDFENLSYSVMNRSLKDLFRLNFFKTKHLLFPWIVITQP